jgi:hypothetical protein
MNDPRLTLDDIIEGPEAPIDEDDEFQIDEDGEPVDLDYEDQLLEESGF